MLKQLKTSAERQPNQVWDTSILLQANGFSETLKESQKEGVRL